jgi:hypothetical protein
MKNPNPTLNKVILHNENPISTWINVAEEEVQETQDEIQPELMGQENPSPETQVQPVAGEGEYQGKSEADSEADGFEDEEGEIKTTRTGKKKSS